MDASTNSAQALRPPETSGFSEELEGSAPAEPQTGSFFNSPLDVSLVKHGKAPVLTSFVIGIALIGLLNLLVRFAEGRS